MSTEFVYCHCGHPCRSKQDLHAAVTTWSIVHFLFGVFGGLIITIVSPFKDNLLPWSFGFFSLTILWEVVENTNNYHDLFTCWWSGFTVECWQNCVLDVVYVVTGFGIVFGIQEQNMLFLILSCIVFVVTLVPIPFLYCDQQPNMEVSASV